MNSRLMKLLGVSLVLCLVIGLTLMPISKVGAYYGGYTGYPQNTSGIGYAGFANPYFPTAYSSFGSLGSGVGYSNPYGGAYGGLYGGAYGGLYGGAYGGLYGGAYGGLYGGAYGGLYGGLMGGLYGGLYGGLMGGLYGGLMGGLYGGLMGGLYGGLMGGLYGGLMGGLYGGLMGGLYGGLMGGLYGSMLSPFGVQNLYYPVETTGGLTYQVPFMQIAPLLGIAGLYNQLFPNLFNPQQSIVNVSTPSLLNVTFPTPVQTIDVTPFPTPILT